jgi:hypothetical protein
MSRLIPESTVLPPAFLIVDPTSGVEKIELIDISLFWLHIVFIIKTNLLLLLVVRSSEIVGYFCIY